jgi:hypothetical protein
MDGHSLNQALLTAKDVQAIAFRQAGHGHIQVCGQFDR